MIKLTETIIKAICKAKVLGQPLETCAQLAGVNRNSIYNWIRQGKKKKGNPLCKKLNTALAAANAKFINDNMENLRRHAKISWQCSAWLLERREPAAFAKINERHEYQELKRTLADLQRQINDGTIRLLTNSQTLIEAGPKPEENPNNQSN